MSEEFWNKPSPKELDIHLQNIFDFLEISYTRGLKPNEIIDSIKKGITKLLEEIFHMESCKICGENHKGDIYGELVNLLGIDHKGYINQSLENLKKRLEL